MDVLALLARTRIHAASTPAPSTDSTSPRTLARISSLVCHSLSTNVLAVSKEDMPVSGPGRFGKNKSSMKIKKKKGKGGDGQVLGEAKRRPSMVRVY